MSALAHTLPADVADSLRRLATLPNWLMAARQPARVCSALARAVPEFAAGELMIRDCDIGHVRIKRGVWIGVYTLTIDRLQPNQRQVVTLRGTIIPPDQPAPEMRGAHVPSDQPAFGTDGWHCYLPELRLNLESQPPERKLAALPILTDPETARAL